jgi:hypothetical protein
MRGASVGERRLWTSNGKFSRAPTTLFIADTAPAPSTWALDKRRTPRGAPGTCMAYLNEILKEPCEPLDWGSQIPMIRPLEAAPSVAANASQRS